jgi:hypothetical protein
MTITLTGDAGSCLFLLAILIALAKIIAPIFKGWFLWGMISIALFINSHNFYETDKIRSFAGMIIGFIVFLFLAYPCFKKNK